MSDKKNQRIAALPCAAAASSGRTLRRCLMAFLSAVLLTAGWGVQLFAAGVQSASYKITRGTINQGGRPKAASSFELNSAVGEVSAGVVSGSTRKVSDGMMKIYYYPGTITTVALSPGDGAGEVDVTWVAPDEGHYRYPGLGAVKYVIKFSTYTSPGVIDTQAKFENSSTYTQTLVPKNPGLTETFTLSGLQPGTSYYIAIEARDADNNQSYLSNQVYSWAQNSVLSVDITNENNGSKSYGFGSVTMSSAVVSTSTIRVTNTGTTPATWSLRASTITAGSPWQLTKNSIGIDLFRFSAAFNDSKPPASGFSSAGNEDRLIPTDALSSVTTFSIDGSRTGVNVPIDDSRLIWFLLETPSATSTTQEQQIQVTVTANP